LLQNPNVSLVDYNDSDSVSSSSSGEEQELTQNIFTEQVKFFCQMKDFLLSQQSALRQQLEALNFQLIKKRRHQHHHHHMRRHRLGHSSTNLHIPIIPSIPSSVKSQDIPPGPDLHSHVPPPENIQQFYSCSTSSNRSGNDKCFDKNL
jgi:hypothetical protein